ncbi:DNA-directed RNA polymerase I subunit RPA43-like [Ornithodoros turicata]|uniref:DNA-directed RNA polymerase I subunit RPA43-like n=1 Tax=Ornithodoros turicata TaxID=34597 RepID=UPI003139A0D4
MAVDKYSLVHIQEKAVHVPLPPSYIGSRNRGVRQLLDSWKGQYVQRLHGILLRYERLRFQHRSSAIIDDQPYVHDDVVADFYVFTPEVGSIVRGCINRMTKSHLGCLIHGSINGSIPYNPQLVPYLRVGQEVLCKIQLVYMHKNHTLRLGATIDRQCVQLMLESGIACPPDWSDGVLSEDQEQGWLECEAAEKSKKGKKNMDPYDSDETVALEPLNEERQTEKRNASHKKHKRQHVKSVRS